MSTVTGDPVASGLELSNIQENPPIDQLGIQVREIVWLFMPILFDIGKLPLNGKLTLDNETFGKLWKGLSYDIFSIELWKLLRDMDKALEFFRLLSKLASTHPILTKHQYTIALLIRQFDFIFRGVDIQEERRRELMDRYLTDMTW
jgi:hypothetical protein